MAVAVPALLLVALFAAADALRLMRRARWLLLAIAVLFLAATPGERVAGPLGGAGVTWDGVRLAAEHLLRLVLLLGTLAWLLRALGRAGLLGGLHCLLAPLGSHRDRLVLRLLLTLEYAEAGEASREWRQWLDPVPADTGPEQRLPLEVQSLRHGDVLLLAALLAAALLTQLP